MADISQTILIQVLPTFIQLTAEHSFDYNFYINMIPC